MRFEVYEDSGGSSRWRLMSSNGQNVAGSGEGFPSHGNAKRAADAFRKNAGSSTFEVYADAGGKYRWRAKSSNGQTVATSGQTFSTQSNARRAALNIEAKAGSATSA
jgi:uncharacterized protein YegP (UPF0339 family)